MVQVKLFRDGFFAEAITEQLEDSAHDGSVRWFKRDPVAEFSREHWTQAVVTPAGFEPAISTEDASATTMVRRARSAVMALLLACGVGFSATIGR